MKADLTQTGDNTWMLHPEKGASANLVGHDKREGDQVCDHPWLHGDYYLVVKVPKKTLGKGEA